MPTYEYICEKCDHRFDKFQSMKDDPLKVCPRETCPKKTWGKGKVKRVMGAGAGLIFKGSGFYITDYRSENYKQSAKKESSSGGSKEGSGSGGADKPSAAPAPAPKKDSKPKPSAT
jgi:putative FmdB family regulatory protein